MPWSWTRRPSSPRGKHIWTWLWPSQDAWLTGRNSGLVLASGYLSTASPIDHSFAFDKPLHTVGVVLLVTGLAVVALEACISRNAQPQLPTRYIAIPLSQGQSRTPSEEVWTEAGQPGKRRGWTVKAIGALLTVLLFAICGRIAIFHHVMKHLECSGPSALVRKPLVVHGSY